MTERNGKKIVQMWVTETTHKKIMTNLNKERHSKSGKTKTGKVKEEFKSVPQYVMHKVRKE